jgi:chromosome partitioning protein
MLHEASFTAQRVPHVIVVGNEKGGSGKTAIAMHISVALLKNGHRVGTLDLDSNQKSLTRYIENWRIWANYRRIALEIPMHRDIPRSIGAKLEENEAEELATFEAAVCGFEQSIDFLVIDTPANDGYLMRLAHLVADTLVTPINDSFLDFGPLASIDPITHEVTGTGHYAAMVSDTRRLRRLFDRGHTDWLTVRNRFSLGPQVSHSLDKLAMILTFRPIDGFAERIVYRKFFPSGLTAFDPVDEITLGHQPSELHVAAKA